MPTCKKCGEVVGALEMKDGLCVNCLPPESAKELKESIDYDNMMKINAKEEDIAGIKGWLKFLFIMIILNIISALLIVFKIIDISYMPNSEYLYIASIITIIFGTYLIYLMIKRKAIFPKVYIGATIIFMVHIIIKDLFLGADYFEKKDVIRLIISIATNIAWILYMLNSKRVKATFVN